MGISPNTLELPEVKALVTFGLSDFRLIEIKRSYGPQLQFTFTWLVDTPEGKQLAQSTPGLRYVKRTNGEYKILPPTRAKTENYTYYCSIFTNDLLELIEENLVQAGWKAKVGANNPVENLLQIEGNLNAN